MEVTAPASRDKIKNVFFESQSVFPQMDYVPIAWEVGALPLYLG